MILAGTAAIVTGGAVRIGRQIVRSLAAQGVNVCIHYGTSAHAAEEAAQEAQELGVRACTVQADFLQPVEAATAVFRAAAELLGPIQILVNSAAIFEPGMLQTTDASQWHRHLAINLEAPFFLTQAFARQIPMPLPGAVINIADWRGERPIPGHAAYTISKAGLIAQTQLLAQELGPRIRVNAISPGAILPPPGESAAIFAERGSKNPLHSTGSPEQVAHALLYLLGADFVTGEVLHVTGGEQLKVK